MVDGISWSVAFAVVVLGPLRLKTIALRSAALGFCGIVLFLSGALEYLRTLSQYTARVQFPAVSDRPRMVEFVSTVFVSPNMKYFYLACALGWLLGIALLRARARLLCVAAAVSFVCFLAYGVVYLLLEGAPWMPPIPIYVEQCLLPLYLAAGVAGYWAVLQAAARKLPLIQHFRGSGIAIIKYVRRSALAIVQRVRIAAIRHGNPRFARWLLPLSRFFDPSATMARGLARETGPRVRFLPIVAGFMAVAIIPALLVDFTKTNSAKYANKWNEPWPSEPELLEFFKTHIGRSLDQPIRGSVAFWHLIPDTTFTITTLWANGIHTVDEYSQLVTPQALYILRALLQNNLIFVLNAFVPLPGPSWDTFFETLQLFGVRFYVAEPEGAKEANKAG